MTPDNFHLFPGLPLEIQDRIWELCLPRRVISPCYENEPQDSVFPADRMFSLPVRPFIPFRPPLISQVCKRARATAMRCGQFTPVLVSGGWNPSRGNVWLSKTDLVFFNIDSIDYGLDNANIEDGDAAPKVFELARDLGRPLLIDSMFGGNCCWKTTEYRLYNHFLRGREQVHYVVAQIYLYVSPKDWNAIVKTGLFGLFGEDIAIVPIADKTKLQQYGSLYRTYSTKDPIEDWVPEELDEHIEGVVHFEFEPRMAIRNLIEVICNERGKNNVSADEMMNEDDSLKEDHPLVKEFGITMPTFEKVIIFELRGVETPLDGT